MSEDFIEVKEQLINMYNFNKHIKIELKPLGAKAILDYIDSKDKEIERLNNIIDELHILFIEFDRNVMRRKYVDANMINLEIKEKLQELKEGK